MIIPFSIDNDIHRMPFITLAVAVICIAVFIEQEISEDAYYKSYRSFCKSLVGTDSWLTLRDMDKGDRCSPCVEFVQRVIRADDEKTAIMLIAREIKPSGIFKDRKYEVQYNYRVILNEIERFKGYMPENIRLEWAYLPREMSHKKMITSSLSHGNLRHIAGNLAFFLVVACTLELIIGHLSILLFFYLACITTSLSYSYAVIHGFETDLPSLGLSGVVSGAMLLLAVLMPKAKITLCFWSGFFVIPIKVPAIIFSGWFFYRDYMHMKEDLLTTNIGYVAHVAGGVTGILVGLIYLLFWREYIKKNVEKITGIN